ncbi:RHS repeat-associated core domain-containing protein [Streptomyces sp. NPDC005526]|uniref:RHS repeat domain-containing protein n=1 Tax=Streptomyces sp. NPDC005526 TaxID=3156885 RepID=UPI0033BADEA0
MRQVAVSPVPAGRHRRYVRLAYPLCRCCGARTSDWSARTWSRYTYTSDGNRDSSTTDGVKITYGYNASAQLTRTTLPSTNGYVETRAYDAAGRLTDISSAKGNATLTSTHVAYDANGQPERIDDVRGTTATSHYYSYDATGRLLTDCTSSTKADTCPSGSPTTAFTYDKVGNRLTQTEDGKTTSYSYNDADELTQSTTGTSKTAYDYDADGNQTASGANKFTYDAANRLTSATVGSATYGYTYDADGNRVAASKNGSTLRTMTWDLNNKLPLLATENGTAGSLIADYQYNPVEQIQGETTGAGTFYHHHDLLGSVTNITDANGALQRSYDYTAFGEVTQTDVATNPPTNRFTYTGEYKEPTTNAAGYYLRARNYDPDTGRLTTRDPYAPSEDTPYIQPYAYVENAPTSRTDPSGMCSVTTQLKDVFTGNWGWNNNCAKEDRETAAKPPAVQAAKNLSDTTTRSLINDSGQASLGFLDGLTFGTFSHLSGAQVTCPSAYNMGLYASMVPFPVTGGRRLALEGAEYATASVWSRIAATQPAYPSTLVPRSFNLMTATGRQIWVHPNATKHIAEEIMHNSFSRHLKTEEMLVGLVRSVDDATRQGIQYGRRVLSHGWELIIVPGKTVLDNPVLKHARRLG